MVPSLPSNVTEAANRASFGHRTGVFRSLRTIPARVAWVIAGLTAIVAVFVVVAGSVAGGLLMVPTALLLLVAYRYLLPPEGGRRWLAAYATGFIETTATQARMARWSDVVGVELDPPPLSGFTLGLNPDPDGIADPGAPPAPPIVVSLTELQPRARLVEIVERHVPGTIPLARREVWHQQGRRGSTLAAALCALVLVPVVALAARPPEPGSAVDASASASPTRPVPTTPYSFYVAGPESTPTNQPSIPAVDPGATSSGPGVVASLPKSVYDYGDVCTGSVFTAAPAYGAPAPHFVFLHQPEFYFIVPEQWESSDPALVQIVACITVATGSQVRICKYSGDDGKVISQKLLRSTWDITVRETRTGRILGHTNFRGGDTQCDDFITTFAGVADEIQYTEPTSKQLQDSIGRYVQ